MAVIGRNSTPIFLMFLIAFWVPPRSAVAADYLYGSIAGWGNLIDPDGDCTFSVSRDGIEIRLGELSHVLDAERGRLNAPRVLRSVDGDYAVQVTVDGRLPLPETGGGRATAYLSGGLLVWADAENYVRLERAKFSRNGQENDYANFEMWHSGRRVRLGLFSDFPLDAERPVQLRLEVRGDEVRGLVRHEGDDWHELGQATLERHGNLLTGIHSLNTTGQNVTVAFSRFDLNNSFEPEVASTSSRIKLNPVMLNEPRPTARYKNVARPKPREFGGSVATGGSLSVTTLEACDSGRGPGTTLNERSAQQRTQVPPICRAAFTPRRGTTSGARQAR